MHAIVSSALVPLSVTKHLQETHHAAAPVAAPISAPAMASMVVGGPSHAPVRVPTTIASLKPSGVTYTKTEVPKNAQAFSGFTGQEGPHTMRKLPVAWKGMAPSKPPVSLKARMACAAIVDNAVASSSGQTLDLPWLHSWSTLQLPHWSIMLSMLLTKRPRGRPIKVLKKAQRTQCMWHHLILP